MKTESSNKDGRFSIEGLESREVMAGNVTAAVVNGSLNITGDNLGNGFLVDQVGAHQYKLTGTYAGGGATSINGQAYVILSNVTKDVSLNLKGGEDYIFFRGVQGGNSELPQDLKINAGDGKDTVYVDDFLIRRDGVFQMGAGDDAIIFERSKVGRDVRFDGGSGNDLLSFNNTVVGRDVVASMGAGGDTLSLTKSTILQDLKVTGDAGYDFVGATDSTVYRDAALNLGADQSAFIFYQSSFRRDLKMTSDGAASVNMTFSSVGRDLVEQFKASGDIFTTKVSVERDVKISTGNGSDSIGLSQMTIKGDLKVNTGGGADEVRLYDIQADEVFSDLGSDADSLYYAFIRARRGSFKGGSGADDLDAPGYNTFTQTPVNSSFET